MNNAERIGLPSFLGWLVNNGPWAALLFAWIITPVMLYVVKAVFESKIIFTDYHPWHDAFRGFMPGDLFLGVAFASAVQLSDELDTKQHWYNSGLWHLIVLCGAVVAGLLARKFLDKPMYEKRQMRSPSKLYHDVVLYCGFGYLMFTVGMSVLVGAPRGTWKYVMLASLLAWVGCLIIDQKFTTKPTLRRLGIKSHPRSWSPIWR